jgi:hypothetical protein
VAGRAGCRFSIDKQQRRGRFPFSGHETALVNGGKPCLRLSVEGLTLGSQRLGYKPGCYVAGVPIVTDTGDTWLSDGAGLRLVRPHGALARGVARRLGAASVETSPILFSDGGARVASLRKVPRSRMLDVALTAADLIPAIGLFVPKAPTDYDYELVSARGEAILTLMRRDISITARNALGEELGHVVNQSKDHARTLEGGFFSPGSHQHTIRWWPDPIVTFRQETPFATHDMTVSDASGVPIARVLDVAERQHQLEMLGSASQQVRALLVTLLCALAMPRWRRIPRGSG